jgi:hypothetical protein
MSETGKRKRATRWTPAQGREVVERWRGSGQSAAAFGAQHHISTSRLWYWSKQLELQRDTAPQFVAVSVPAETGSVHAVEIVVSGLTVRVREGADASFVAQLVSALQRGSAAPC